ncbi:MAG: methylated-DNA--[protein]-cysteine S-methyltransferase [Neisseria sp.]|uniref:methylated-DNA--[protein]-cysteine S-methyltransferase n=1 Tax=Neisseria sp. TaxID=192066 RepID=UPI0026DD2B73|nr:methylated-DNA--[protein]-cysteine S-methyltransferase [Neisseria sp.]MDO4640266.1 methylated-DNA--[protein]-cysteine S-methyltransferase [Neisseria sp.]
MSESKLSKQYTRVSSAIEYLYDNAHYQPSLEEIAKQVHLSPAYFQKVFTQFTGLSPKQMLSYLNVEMAKQYLSSSKSLMQTALATGLSGTGRLHDLFIKIEGMTPFEYKNGGVNLTIYYAFLNSPLGELLIANTDKGICFMHFVDDQQKSLSELMTTYPQAQFLAQFHILQQQAMSFFNETPQGLTLHIKGTPFQLKVWQALLSIPSGQLSSYDEIAEQIDCHNAARAVGSAVGKNPIAILIPCHRVIKKNGIIGQYRWGRSRKMILLAQEFAKQEKHANE